MANEVQISATLLYNKSPAKASLSTSFFATQTGDKYEAGIAAIGVTEETLQKGDIGTIGWLAIRNMDTTNFVQIGAVATQYSIKLLAGKGSVVAWNGSAVYIKADTAPVEVEYLIIEL